MDTSTLELGATEAMEEMARLATHPQSTVAMAVLAALEEKAVIAIFSSVEQRSWSTPMPATVETVETAGTAAMLMDRGAVEMGARKAPEGEMAGHS